MLKKRPLKHHHHHHTGPSEKNISIYAKQMHPVFGIPSTNNFPVACAQRRRQTVSTARTRAGGCDLRLAQPSDTAAAPSPLLPQSPVGRRRSAGIAAPIKDSASHRAPPARPAVSPPPPVIRREVPPVAAARPAGSPPPPVTRREVPPVAASCCLDSGRPQPAAAARRSRRHHSVTAAGCRVRASPADSRSDGVRCLPRRR